MSTGNICIINSATWWINGVKVTKISHLEEEPAIFDRAILNITFEIYRPRGCTYEL